MKIAIIGAGNVGATCAMRILEADLADLVLLDIVGSLARGKAEDLMDAASLIGHKRIIKGTSDYSDIEGSDIIIISAGLTRKPGMDREELLNKNASIVKDVVQKINRYTENPIIIVVTNPLDVMAYVAYKESGLNHKRVIGMAGVLDSSRMNLMISRALNRPLQKVNSLVLGTHGETMVPAVSQSKVDNSYLVDSVARERLAEIIKKTKSRGAEIISYLGTGSAYYAPSAGVFRMVKAIVNDTKELLPASCLLEGGYGIKGVYLGVPAKIGRDGLIEIVQLHLPDDELKQLMVASMSVQKQIDALKGV